MAMAVLPSRCTRALDAPAALEGKAGSPDDLGPFENGMWHLPEILNTRGFACTVLSTFGSQPFRVACFVSS